MPLPIFLTRLSVLVLAAVTVSAAQAESGESTPLAREYFSVDVSPMVASFGPEHIVSDQSITQNAWHQMDDDPRVVVPADCEAYLLPPERQNSDYQGYRIVGEKPQGVEIQGHLFVLRDDPETPRQMVLARLDFDVDAFVKTPADRKEFLRAKGLHFQRLWSAEIAGAAMFRHLARSSLRAIGEKAVSSGSNRSQRRRDNVDDTIQLMSGGRAVSENLALDIQMATTEEQGVMKSIAGVRGITVREINWDSLLRDEPTELDPLAASIPYDQHAVLLPSFDALAKIVEVGNKLARPAVQYFEPQSRETNVLVFYQQQLGLPLNALTRQVGGALIDEVAITGSDPYFRTGTDVAVLMQSKQPKFLLQAILAQVAAIAEQQPGVTKIQHSFGGHRVTQWSTEDRHFCSYVTATEDAVVVTNSLTQMTNVLGCADKKRRALGSLDEYRFFRQRYPRHADDESALIIISDATIRRWCGPQWRIAASRRTTARATIAEMTMQNADQLVTGSVTTARQLTSVYSVPPAGELWLAASGVRSDRFGTLQFQTPIAEMGLTRASNDEIKRYENWRNRYERQWRNAFDPIALKLSLSEDSVTADLSVIPLMIRTQYRSWLSWIGDAKLKPGAADRHQETLASVDVALSMQAPLLVFASNFLSQQANTNVDLLSWIDGSFSIYMDHDQQWMKRFAERPDFEIRSADNLREIPVALFLPSSDNFRMTAFVVAARALLDQFSPNMIRWETVEYNGMKYVVATSVENTAIGRAEDMPRGYYVTTAEGLTLSLNRHIIERAIDRHLASKKARQEQAEEPAVKSSEETEIAEPVDDKSAQPQIVARITGRGAMTMAMADPSDSQRRMSRLSWSNIPILNYFRHRYPDRDPFAVYQQLLGERLTEPGGGSYEWSDRLQTYQSTLYGDHLSPRMGPPISPALQLDDRIQSNLSFDGGGLRAIFHVTTSK